MKLTQSTKKYLVVIGLSVSVHLKELKDQHRNHGKPLKFKLFEKCNNSYAIFTVVHKDRSESKTHKMARTKDLTRNYNFF